MAGLRPRFEKGPITFLATTVANGGNIKAGMFVEPDGSTGRIKPAVAGSTKVLGLAIGDASASDFANADTTDTWGNTTVNAQYPPNDVAVAYQGVWDVKAVGAIAFGALVKVGAGSIATDAAAGTAATLGQVVGRCVQEGGIADGAKGKILITGIGA